MIHYHHHTEKSARTIILFQFFMTILCDGSHIPHVRNKELRGVRARSLNSNRFVVCRLCVCSLVSLEFQKHIFFFFFTCTIHSTFFCLFLLLRFLLILFVVTAASPRRFLSFCCKKKKIIMLVFCFHTRTHTGARRQGEIWHSHRAHNKTITSFLSPGFTRVISTFSKKLNFLYFSALRSAGHFAT